MNEIDWLQLANQLSVSNTLQTSIVPEGDKGVLSIIEILECTLYPFVFLFY
jgi:hypothetical protein